MPIAVNTPILVGPVHLLYVQNMTMNEGYRIERIMGSKFSQAIAPTTKTINIEAMLIGPDRFADKKTLEALALTSRLLVSATASLFKIAGIPVVSGLTISTDMQITELRFAQNVQKRDALDVSISLQYVPRSSLLAIIGEVADLALAAGTTIVGSLPTPGSAPRVPGAPI